MILKLWGWNWFQDTASWGTLEPTIHDKFLKVYLSYGIHTSWFVSYPGLQQFSGRRKNLPTIFGSGWFWCRISLASTLMMIQAVPLNKGFLKALHPWKGLKRLSWLAGKTTMNQDVSPIKNRCVSISSHFHVSLLEGYLLALWAHSNFSTEAWKEESWKSHLHW